MDKKDYERFDKDELANICVVNCENMKSQREKIQYLQEELTNYRIENRKLRRLVDAAEYNEEPGDHY